MDRGNEIFGNEKYSFSYLVKHAIAEGVPHFSRKGTVFHESRGKHYADTGFTEGDVLGIMIKLPEKNPVSRFPPTYKDKVGVTPSIKLNIYGIRNYC